MSKAEAKLGKPMDGQNDPLIPMNKFSKNDPPGAHVELLTRSPARRERNQVLHLSKSPVLFPIIYCFVLILDLLSSLTQGMPGKTGHHDFDLKIKVK